MAARKVYGGGNNFKWEDALTDKYRENYLGQTLAGSSRPTFNNPRPNAMWYLKDGQGKPEAPDLEAIKEQENKIMLQMMGILPRDPPKVQENRIDKADLMKILAKNEDDKDEIDQADRGAGIGFGAVQRHSTDLIDSVKKKDAESKYKTEPRAEEFRSSSRYEGEDDSRGRKTDSRQRDSDMHPSDLPRRDQEKKHKDKDKHKHKDKHKSKDKDKHKHKEKEKEKKHKESSRKRSRSRSASPRDRSRNDRHDDYDRKHDRDRRDRSEYDRDRRRPEPDRSYSRHEDRGRQRSRSRSPPSPKRRRLDTPSPPRRSGSPPT